MVAIRVSGHGELWPLLKREWAAHIGSSQEATEMNTHALLYILFLRLYSPDDVPQIRYWSFLLSQTFLEILSHTYPAVCLLGNSKSFQVDSEDDCHSALGLEQTNKSVKVSHGKNFVISGPQLDVPLPRNLMP